MREKIISRIHKLYEYDQFSPDMMRWRNFWFTKSDFVRASYSKKAKHCLIHISEID